jgi:hypothetical protein
MEDILGECKVFPHIYSTYTYTCMHSSRAMCAYTFLQGWLNTSANGEDDSFPPVVAKRQHEEILCSKIQNERTMLLNKSSNQ